MVSSACDSFRSSSDDPDNGNATTGNGGAAYKGSVLITKSFNDMDFAARGGTIWPIVRFLHPITQHHSSAGMQI